MPMFSKELLFLIACLSIFLLDGISQIGPSGQPVKIKSYSPSSDISVGDSIITEIFQASKEFSIEVEGSKTETYKNESIFYLIQFYVNQSIYEKESVNVIVDTVPKLFLKIHRDISALQTIPKNQLSTERLKNVSKEIEEFPISKEKFFLKIRYLFLASPQTMSERRLYDIVSGVINETRLINDKFEEGEACLYIGDYVFEARLRESAALAYFNAQLNFYASKKDSLTKYHYQGVTCEKLANIFSETNIITLLQKQSNYYYAAYEFFTRANEKYRANEAYQKYLNNYAYLVGRGSFEMTERKSIEASVMHDLVTRFGNKLKYSVGDTLSNQFLWFNIAGNILKARKKFNVANQMFLYAAVCCIMKNDFKQLSGCLLNIALTYSLLNNSELALSYSNLARKASIKVVDNVFSKNVMWNKADVFFTLKKLDSALILTEELIRLYIRDSSLNRLSDLEQGILAFELKYKIFKQLGNADSVSFFEGKVNELRLNLLAHHVAPLLDYERELTAECLNLLKTWEVSTEKYEKQEIEKLNDTLRLYILLLAIASLIIFYFIMKFFKREKLKKEELSWQLTFRDVVNHDFKRLISKIPKKFAKIEQTEKLGKEVCRAIEYTQDSVEYVRVVSKVSLGDMLTIQEQIELSRRYANAIKNLSLPENYVINIRNDINSPEVNNVKVPLLLVNNFIKNSVEHGTDARGQMELDIRISCKESLNGFSLTIEDDGCGINDAKARGGTTGKGLKLAKQTIDFYNRQNEPYKILFSEEEIIDKKEKKIGKGTIVKIDFIKKRAWK